MEERKAPKKRLGQKKEPPEAFMASFFASVEIYQTKILVRYIPSTINDQSCEGESNLHQTVLFSQNYLARNFYNLRFLALFVAFAINFILLFYKVNSDANSWLPLSAVTAGNISSLFR